MCLLFCALYSLLYTDTQICIAIWTTKVIWLLLYVQSSPKFTSLDMFQIPFTLHTDAQFLHLVSA
jgi:hypothetical protein